MVLLLLLCFIQIPVANANSEDPDRTFCEENGGLIWVCTVCQLLFGGLQTQMDEMYGYIF